MSYVAFQIAEILDLESVMKTNVDTVYSYMM